MAHTLGTHYYRTVHLEEAFETIVQHFLATPEVIRAKMFGAPTLKVGGKVFACLYKGKLVVKLPQGRVSALVASGQGEHFDPGMGRMMKEWVTLEPRGEDHMRELIQKAKDFVAPGR